LISCARTRNTAGGNNEENLAGKTGGQGFSTQDTQTGERISLLIMPRIGRAQGQKAPKRLSGQEGYNIVQKGKNFMVLPETSGIKRGLLN